jgi:hypothetical protein
MFELLGRWRIAPDFAERAEGLLTPREIDEALTILDSVSATR